MSHLTRMARKRHELLADLVDVAEYALREYDVPPAAATAAANALADRLADHWGGQNITFPKDFHWKLAKIEVEIYGRLVDGNYDKLAMEYGMTERGIRKLIARVRAKIEATRQAGLFDLSKLG